MLELGSSEASPFAPGCRQGRTTHLPPVPISGAPAWHPQLRLVEPHLQASGSSSMVSSYACALLLQSDLPLYAELFGDRITDPSKRTVMRILKETTMTLALIPGGFSEAATPTPAPHCRKYAYIADRIGFVRSAIEASVDIIPAYTYGLNDMYDTPRFGGIGAL